VVSVVEITKLIYSTRQASIQDSLLEFLENRKMQCAHVSENSEKPTYSNRVSCFRIRDKLAFFHIRIDGRKVPDAIMVNEVSGFRDAKTNITSSD
jgi:hypothetical protein